MATDPLLPSEVSPVVGGFDRFAEGASKVASRAWFFAFCVLLVVVWAPSIIVLKDIDTWKLIINTLTTIVTFLMVALLQNSQTRADLALQHKLNAIAEMLAHIAEDRGLSDDVTELRDAVGLETRESTSDNGVDEKGSAQKEPAQKKSAQKKPAQKKPAQKRPAQKRPAQKRPAQKKPAQKSSGTKK